MTPEEEMALRRYANPNETTNARTALAAALHATDVIHPAKNRWPDDGCAWCTSSAHDILATLTIQAKGAKS